MDRLTIVALVGGFFAILTFIHFAIDWIFQSHAEAIVKHNNPKIRAKHCLIYTSPFVLFLWWCGLSWPIISIAACILFFSHFVEDTYWPVLLWAKYIRRPPEMQWRIVGFPVFDKPRMLGPTDHIGKIRDDIYDYTVLTWRDKIFMSIPVCKTADYDHVLISDAQRQLDHGGFMEFINTPMGKILMIAIDQIIHITFLLPIAYMIVIN